jgi:NodT family efflux transporter outer membrane factor (OMF) lipoprotein
MRNDHNKFFLLIAVSMVILGASCKVSKDYRQPDPETPLQFRGATYSDTAGIADFDWKVFFTDTTLQGLIQKGIDHNNDLQLAIKNMEIASAQVRYAKQLLLPGVGLQATGQYNRPSKNSLSGLSTGSFLGSDHIEDYNMSVNVSWEADIWGKIGRRKEAALAQYLQTQEVRKAVQTRLVADIAKGFFNLLMLDKQLQVTKINLTLSDSTLQLTKLLKEAGETTSLSVQQTEAQRESVALLIPQLEENIALQENALQLLTGQYPDSIKRWVGLFDIKLPAKFSAGIPAALVSRRPDVRAAEMDVMIANAKSGIAQASLYPSFTIAASGGVQALKASNWFNIPGSLFGIVTGGIMAPVFARRELKTNYEVAKIQREQSVTQFRQAVLNAVTEVSDRLVQSEKLKQRAAVAQNQVAILQQAIQNARLLYKSDMANYLEVITAQSNALQAELNWVAIQGKELVVMVDLYRSLGGGWK